MAILAVNSKEPSHFWAESEKIMSVTKIGDDIHFSCPFHVTTNQIEDELVALNLETSFYYGVDGIGTQIWRLLIDENMTLAQACAKLVEEYDVDTETCQREVRAFIEQLIDANLLETVAA
jgi:hypothetical protein